MSTNEMAEILSGYPRLALAAGAARTVSDPARRAGAAAPSPRRGHGFDPKDMSRLPRHLLPGHAVPLYLRLLPEVAVTGTCKLRKTDLKRAGFDPKLVSDPLFHRNSERETDRSLTREVDDRLQAGALRL